MFFPGGIKVEEVYRRGTIIRAAGGFYDVLLDNGKTVRCTIRGRHKKSDEAAITGDNVKIVTDESGDGVVEELLPRKNSLIRPQIANVTQIIAVVSACKPAPEWHSLNGQLLSAEIKEINAVICLNKIDLVEEGKLKEISLFLSSFPYEVLLASAEDKTGLERLKELLANNITVFSGPSGVGKTSLINAILPWLGLKTSGISSKIERGRHTTRHVELIPMDKCSGMIADTPGFSRIDIPHGNMVFPDTYYPEIRERRNDCRFRNCLHINEPGCAIREAVSAGEINEIRYGHYLTVIEELNQ